MSINVSPDTKAYLEQQVASGQASSVGELLETLAREQMEKEAREHGISMEEYVELRLRVNEICDGSVELLPQAEANRMRANARKLRRNGR